MWPHKFEPDPTRVPVIEASGMVLFARSTQRIGITHRSIHVQGGNCWGTIGGVMEPRALPRESAIRELLEETGYSGEIDLYLAYIFSSRQLRYYNYVGVVPQEFFLDPNCQHIWENDELRWFALDDLLHLIERQPGTFHFGLRRLMNNARDLIERLALGKSPSIEWFRSP